MKCWERRPICFKVIIRHARNLRVLVVEENDQLRRGGPSRRQREVDDWVMYFDTIVIHMIYITQLIVYSVNRSADALWVARSGPAESPCWSVEVGAREGKSLPGLALPALG